MKLASLLPKINGFLAGFSICITLFLAACTGNGHNAADDSVYTSVEKSAEYPGGIESFYSYLGQNIHYPEYARQKNITGRVIITFVVERNGSVTNIRVLRGIGYGCDEEAVRVLKESPKWAPGVQKGRVVRQQYTIPINFTLQD